MSLIEAAGLTKQFKSRKQKPGLRGALRGLISAEQSVVTAVDHISFRIEPGELVGYLGPNGAGKTTTIKMLTGVLVPTVGTVSVRGLVPHKDRIRNNLHISVVFGQRSQLWWLLPVMDSFNLLQKIYEIPPARFKENLDTFREMLELDPLLAKPARSLSLGQRTRCELAAAFLHDPDVVYLDEPTIGLDILAKERIREFIRQLNRERGTTVILTTHDLGDVDNICRRIMVIDKGKIIYDGSIDEIKRRFGKYRALRLDLAATPAELSLDSALPADDLRVEAQGERKVRVTFNRDRLTAPAVLELAHRRWEILDFGLEETGIDNVIKQIYQGALDGDDGRTKSAEVAG